MNFKRINTVTGWIVFAIAAITYLFSMERTSSFWDCGEFLVTAYKLEVAHSPGAPLFMLMGRMFAMFSPSPDKAAMFINSISAFSSAFTVMFLFWSITHFARKIIARENTDNLTNTNIVTIIGAGLVGALAYTFSDTFWFSAVEAEVYALSSFFTALTFWSILKWEHIANKDPYADRWLVFIFFLMGLSVGVHLLNLLTIPTVVLVYYLRKTEKPTMVGGILAFLLGGVILGFVQYGIIQGLSIVASKFELYFTNSFGMPFNSGTIIFILLIAAIVFFLLRFAKKNGKYKLYLSTFCFAFTLLGFAAPYATTVIRSNADVPIDMVNPDNVVSLIPYLQREQYGSQPIFSGYNYDAEFVGEKEELEPIYDAVTVDGKDRYLKVGEKPDYNYEPRTLFPRLWDKSNDKPRRYEIALGLEKGEHPTMGDNMRFFFDYQLNWMYWRYFMWNYAGRQNDYQGQGEAKNANWISGIKPLDKMMGKGDIDKANDSYKNNRARNEYYMLPFILGIIGLLYHYKQRKGDTAVVFSLFIMTGLAIVVYLNNSPAQPRERDYAYVSTYAFAIWIGLGVMQVTEWLNKLAKGVSAPALATAICLVAVPALMLGKNWDDHNRAPKTLAKDHARNMLMSCDSNAILIVNGDNDTYPIWYLQEIEGVRTDVRVVNLNLLNTDWQIEQMFYKINNAGAVPFIWKEEDVRGSRLEGILIYEEPKLKGVNVPAENVIQFITDKKNDRMLRRGKDPEPYFPTRRVSVPVDAGAVAASGLLKGIDSFQILPELSVEYKQNFLYRADLCILNMVAGVARDGWKRPIYFAAGTPASGFEPYLQREGLLSKLIPATNRFSNSPLRPFSGMEKNIDMITKVFSLGNANTSIPYYDDKAKNTLTQYIETANELGLYLIANGRKEDAIKVLDNMNAKISESSYPRIMLPYDPNVLGIIDVYYRAGAQDKARKYAEHMIAAIEKDTDYYMSLSESRRQGYMTDVQMIFFNAMQNAISMAHNSGDADMVKKWGGTLSNLVKKSGLESIYQQMMQQRAAPAPSQGPEVEAN